MQRTPGPFAEISSTNRLKADAGVRPGESFGTNYKEQIDSREDITLRNNAPVSLRSTTTME
jgi:hypothetical protein